jgi:ketosteroid isomerase-like protein
MRVYDREKAAGAWRALALAVVLWGPAAIGAAEPVEPSLWSRLQRIEAAFRAGDAQALRPLLPAEAKVRVDLPGLTDGPRSYGPSQLEVVFQQIFADREDFELAFRRDDVKVPAEGTAFARARWARPGESEAAYVTFTLRADNGGWRIHEILGSR